ncbi:autotransporter outer membrane beta-barrel domain-containing protein [Uliginosibacterium sp. sgz301328]|uniref:autotransporter family protein n=1 Tax=Uliginosibacterium sp. sgz301328 TaxID=3243764 RepID=UPI00359EE976
MRSNRTSPPGWRQCSPALVGLGCVAALSAPAQAQVVLPSSSGSTVQLNSAYPGQSHFTLPADGLITNTGTAIQGDNSQDWQLTNDGSVEASGSNASGVKLGSAQLNGASVFNYGNIATSTTSSNGPAGVQFTNGGVVYNYVGGTISGGSDGLHTDHGSIGVFNYGSITASSQSGIYSGEGAIIHNYAGATISGNYGIVSNGNVDVAIVNDGTITARSKVIWMYGDGEDSIYNGPAGLIQGGSTSDASMDLASNTRDSQLLNYGRIINPQGTTISSQVSGHTYINAGLIQAAGSGVAIKMTGDDNIVYNLNQLSSDATALSFVGNNNLLVLGQQMVVAKTGETVSGPGSVIHGAVTSDGDNRIALTDDGSADNTFTGFSALEMKGHDWVLSNELALASTGSDALRVSSGRLTITQRLTTAGGTTIDDGGSLLIAPGATVISPGGVSNAGVLGGYGQIEAAVLNTGTIMSADAAPGLAGQGGGQFTIIGALVNNGSVDLRGAQPGNRLRVVGNYAGQGTLQIQSALGGDDSPTDQLIIDTGHATGDTAIVVTNAGGTGAQTSNGIRIVALEHGATSAADAFHLDGAAVAGLYDYSLYRNAADQQWYLYSTQTPPEPPPPTPPDPPEPPSPPTPPAPPPQPNYRPEIGAYLANIYAAATMFRHGLFDRTANAVGTDGSRIGWARIGGGHRASRAFDGRMDNDTDTALIHFGADVWRTPLKGGDELRLGLMGGYGNAASSTSALGNRRHSNGTVDGFGAGAYATWFANANRRSGTYLDAWAMYGWQRNKVDGDHLSEQTYHSNTLNASLEAGYIWAPQLSRNWYVVPQAQVMWSNYRNGSHTEYNTGLQVNADDIGGWLSRFGVRVFGDVTLANGPVLQPYVELNWFYDDARSSASFNGTSIAMDNTRQIGDLKLGIAGYVAPRLQLWGEASVQQGGSSYRGYGGMLGARYSF